MEGIFDIAKAMLITFLLICFMIAIALLSAIVVPVIIFIVISGIVYIYIVDEKQNKGSEY